VWSTIPAEVALRPQTMCSVTAVGNAGVRLSNDPSFLSPRALREKVNGAEFPYY
jgi:hypothetical protein